MTTKVAHVNAKTNLVQNEIWVPSEILDLPHVNAALGHSFPYIHLIYRMTSSFVLDVVLFRAELWGELIAALISSCISFFILDLKSLTDFVRTFSIESVTKLRMARVNLV